MDLRFSESDEAFRREIRDWLADNLTGEFAELIGRGGPGDEHNLVAERRRWIAHMAAHRWTCVGWPESHGGRGLSLTQQVIFNEEYARARGPGNLGHIGETLLAPTLLAYGTAEQRERFLPPIRVGEALWCQGYSEPGAGSDLANVQTRAVRDGDEWVITGQKIWTSHANWADWCFALCRTNPDAPKHRGLSYILVPMRQPGIEVRPISQMTGTSEFSEVFFSEARAKVADTVGPIDGGWKVAMGTLAFERGASTLGQQLLFENEFAEMVAMARENGRGEDPIIRQRIGRAFIELRIMRLNALRTLSGHESGELSREGTINKLYWANWHRRLGELCMDVMGPEAELAEGVGHYTPLQRLFLFSRADTIYAGSNQIQRNIIGERALGLPREPRVEQKK